MRRKFEAAATCEAYKDLSFYIACYFFLVMAIYAQRRKTQQNRREKTKMTNAEKEILEVHRMEAENRRHLARKELARLKEEREDAIDLDDREYLKAVCKQIREANMTIILSNKAIKEIDEKLSA